MKLAFLQPSVTVSKGEVSFPTMSWTVYFMLSKDFKVGVQLSNDWTVDAKGKLSFATMIHGCKAVIIDKIKSLLKTRID